MAEGTSMEPERSVASRLAALFLTPVGGGVLGAEIGHAVAPDSVPAMALTTVMLPLALFTGLALWLGSALFLSVLRLLGGLVGVSAKGRPTQANAPFAPPGAIVLVLTAVASSSAAACAVSLLSSRATLLRTLVLYVAVGLAYGVVAWRLARMGFLRPATGEDV
jgi:hypothetical protein